MMIFKNKNIIQGPPEYLIVGLGNPGSKYEFTRHNAGFLALDVFGEKLNCDIKKIEFKSITGKCVINNHICLLMKPQTFMNLSGEAVSACAKFYKIPVEHIIVIYDDITLDVGKLRVRKKGSDGGHNGMKNIIYLLASDNYPRIRIGIGEKPHPEYDLADWVTSKFTDEELKKIYAAGENSLKTVEYILDGKTEKAMNEFNNR